MKKISFKYDCIFFVAHGSQSLSSYFSIFPERKTVSALHSCCCKQSEIMHFNSSRACAGDSCVMDVNGHQGQGDLCWSGGAQFLSSPVTRFQIKMWTSTAMCVCVRTGSRRKRVREQQKREAGKRGVEAVSIPFLLWHFTVIRFNVPWPDCPAGDGGLEMLFRALIKGERLRDDSKS